VSPLEQALVAVDAALADLEPEARAAAAGALAARAAAVLAGVATGSPARRWLRAEDAAERFAVDLARLRRWARRPGVTWASWPTRRRLLIDVEAFDRWLSAGRFAVKRVRSDRDRRDPKPGIRDTSNGPVATVGDRSRAEVR
jgi:hypothetical protein